MERKQAENRNPLLVLVISTVILSCMFIFDVYLLIEKDALLNKLLAAGAIPLLLLLLIPSWKMILKEIVK